MGTRAEPGLHVALTLLYLFHVLWKISICTQPPKLNVTSAIVCEYLALFVHCYSSRAPSSMPSSEARPSTCVKGVLRHVRTGRGFHAFTTLLIPSSTLSSWKGRKASVLFSAIDVVSITYRIRDTGWSCCASCSVIEDPYPHHWLPPAPLPAPPIKFLARSAMLGSFMSELRSGMPPLPAPPPAPPPPPPPN